MTIWPCLVLCLPAAAALHPPPAASAARPPRREAIGAALLALLAPRPLAALADDEVMRGVLQLREGVRLPPLPSGSAATVSVRVVGRNSRGALATKKVVLDGEEFPVEFTVRRSEMREVPDFVWLEEDLYVRADVMTPQGAAIAIGRSKSKAVKENDVPSHSVSYITLERT
ncbi:hypothetical protein AB1Y20_017069 [Prymnesium parvum]|uniref:Uncharacterized protein n=1 Tax=Prymnesium parvum TaxID=97485 RepID=A0AB34IB48_PRYPA